MKRALFVIVVLLSVTFAGNIFSSFFKSSSFSPDSIYIERENPDSIYKIQKVTVGIPYPDSIYYYFEIRVNIEKRFDYMGDTADYNDSGSIIVCFPSEEESLRFFHQCNCDSVVKSNNGYTIDTVDYDQYVSFLNCCNTLKSYVSKYSGEQRLASNYPGDTIFLRMTGGKNDELLDSVLIYSDGSLWRAVGHMYYKWILQDSTCFNYNYSLYLIFKGNKTHEMFLLGD